MSRPLPVLLFVGVVASACSRDATPFDPDPVVVGVVAAPAVAQVVTLSDQVTDALTRLLPALGPRAASLQGPLLRLQAKPKDRAALAEVQRAVDAFAATVLPDFQPDVDALRLELGLAFPN
jgi:hypothetical protein